MDLGKSKLEKNKNSFEKDKISQECYTLQKGHVGQEGPGETV